MKNLHQPGRRLPAFLFCLLFIIGMGSGCRRDKSNNVDQDQIHTTYSLSYDEDFDRSYARATFRFKKSLGRKLELVDPSEVTFGGEALMWDKGSGSYELRMEGWVSGGTFAWTDHDGNVFQNDITMNWVDPDPLFGAIDRFQDFEWYYDGNATTVGETVFAIIDPDFGGSNPEFSQEAFFGGGVLMPSYQLLELEPGGANLWMERRLAGELLDRTSAGGSILSTYKSRSQYVELF